MAALKSEERSKSEDGPPHFEKYHEQESDYSSGAIIEPC